MSWEAVIGLEIHLQLRTGRKLFCRDTVSFGAPPNTQVCPVCLGLPGALPVPDPAAVDLAVRTALALGCTVYPRSIWARKNYFYPDLPKGYQITQFERPLAAGGALSYGREEEAAAVRIRRVHVEEDAGKSVHGRFPGASAVDFNRAGTPLVEIVTEPDLRSAADTRVFLQELKRLLEYLDVSDCNMEEGSLRVDANVSVRPEGDTDLHVKTEIKNVNSFSHIEKAIDLEVLRQIAIREDGGSVEAETLLWDEDRGGLRPMRSKEESHDYRYFPEPDLPPLDVDADDLARARRDLPELPRERQLRFVTEWGVPPYEAGVLTRSRAVADYYEAVAALADPREASKWVMGPVAALQGARGEDEGTFAVPAEALADLLALVADGAVSHAAARKTLAVMADEGIGAREAVEGAGLTQVSDEGAVGAWVAEVLAGHPEAVARYRSGEEKVLGFLMGRVMERSGGSADPRVTRALLQSALDAGA